MDLDEEIKIRKPREIVVDQIQFKKKISVGQNIFEYPISYHTRKLIIQTPIVYIPYSTYKVNNKITFDFYFLNPCIYKNYATNICPLPLFFVIPRTLPVLHHLCLGGL